MAETKATVLVLGASGMLGNAMLRLFGSSNAHDTWGSARSAAVCGFVPPALRERVICGVDVDNNDALMRLFARLRPTVVINCIGLVKQLAAAADIQVRSVTVGGAGLWQAHGNYAR